MMKYNNNSEKQCFGFGINAGTAEGLKTNQAFIRGLLQRQARTGYYFIIMSQLHLTIQPHHYSGAQVAVSQ